MFFFCAIASAATVTTVVEHDPSSLNGPRNPGLPTVDVVAHLVEGSEVDWELFQRLWANAHQTFADAGVQLRLQKARTVRVPPTWLSLRVDDPDVTIEKPELREQDLYAFLGANRIVLREQAVDRLRAIAEGTDSPETTIQVVALGRVVVHFPRLDDQGEWVSELVPTSGLSFPGYLHGDTIPKALRGVITLSPTEKWHQAKPGVQVRLLSHELGHKLINVSHEGPDVCPTDEVWGETSLMLYGSSIDITAGATGRWHQERLLVSPFLYKQGAEGKVFNPDYQKGGGYDDPIYKGLVVDPVCDRKKLAKPADDPGRAK